MNKNFIHILCVLYKSFWDFISAVVRHDRHDHISKTWNFQSTSVFYTQSLNQIFPLEPQISTDKLWINFPSKLVRHNYWNNKFKSILIKNSVSKENFEIMITKFRYTLPLKSIWTIENIYIHIICIIQNILKCYWYYNRVYHNKHACTKITIIKFICAKYSVLSTMRGRNMKENYLVYNNFRR